MGPQHPMCRAIEPNLLSVVAGEKDSAAAGRVEAHAGGCQPCRDELAHFSALEDMIDSQRGRSRTTAPPWRAPSSPRASRICTHAYRVVGSRGSLTGYAGGLARKQFLLDLERSTM